MSSFASRLLGAIAEEPELRAISEELAGAPVAGGWSKKQELGHLIDSATNNRVRFIKAALEGSYAGPEYDGEGWVDLGGYSEMNWAELIELWRALNRALALVLERIPKQRLGTECAIGSNAVVTLDFLIDDYIAHMRHHLDHILRAAG